MIQTPLSERLRVVFAGPRNAGKSSLMNALFGKEAALVSDVPGTTTDPVTRAYEIPGLGPAAITDTPGIDDEGVLGMERVRLALSRSAEADVRVLVTPSCLPPVEAELSLYSEWFEGESGGKPGGKPAILVLTYSDEGVDKTGLQHIRRFIFQIIMRELSLLISIMIFTLSHRSS